MARKPELPGADAFFTAADAPPPTDAKKESKEKPAKTRRGRGPDAAEAEQRAPHAARDQRQVTRSDTNATDAIQMPSIDPAFFAAPGAPAPPLSIPQPPTEKVTLYLPASMLEQLEVCRVRLLTEYGIKAGRSQIAQAALALTLSHPQVLADGLRQLAALWEEYAE